MLKFTPEKHAIIAYNYSGSIGLKSIRNELIKVINNNKREYVVEEAYVMH